MMAFFPFFGFAIFFAGWFAFRACSCWMVWSASPFFLSKPLNSSTMLVLVKEVNINENNLYGLNYKYVKVNINENNLYGLNYKYVKVNMNGNNLCSLNYKCPMCLVPFKLYTVTLSPNSKLAFVPLPKLCCFFAAGQIPSGPCCFLLLCPWLVVLLSILNCLRYVITLMLVFINKMNYLYVRSPIILTWFQIPNYPFCLLVQIVVFLLLFYHGLVHTFS